MTTPPLPDAKLACVLGNPGQPGKCPVYGLVSEITNPPLGLVRLF
jgi:hypothetical protein